MGWESEPLATPGDNEDALRSDFRKTFKNMGGEDVTVQIEVEMETPRVVIVIIFNFPTLMI